MAFTLRTVTPYRGHHEAMMEAALVLRVWKAGQQDLVRGRLVPQGEAQPQLLGL